MALLGAAPAGAQSLAIDIIDYGIYVAEITGNEPDSQGIGTNIVGNICHIETTLKIPAIDGVQFGVRYRLTGLNEGQIVDIRKTMQFPMPLRPPGAPRDIAEYEHNYRQVVGTTSYTGYGFDHPWELVPGLWVMRLWHGPQKLLELAFEVVDGQGRLRPRTDNADCFKLSQLERR